MTRAIVPSPDHISRDILVLRGHRVLLDAHLAALYGVTTKRLNEQVKRNAERFPGDFMWRSQSVAATVSRSVSAGVLKFKVSLGRWFNC